MGFLNYELYCSRPFAENKQSVYIVSFSAGRTRSRRSAGHTLAVFTWARITFGKMYRIAIQNVIGIVI